MATTVDAGFRDFLGKLTPSDTESAAAASHRSSIEGCLKDKLTISAFLRCGSFGHGTSIRGHSDVDFLASLPLEYRKYLSTSVLNRVWEVLDARFPKTNVGIRTPAVAAPFGAGSESVDVVPGLISGSSGYHLIYDIADGDGGWMKTSPTAHKAYVTAVDKKHNGKVKPLIRFIKAWRCYRNVPIYSFYLEMVVAKYADGESSIHYSIDVRQVLSKLHAHQLSKLQDPLGISGYIRPCYSDERRTDALSKLSTALGRAEKAQAAERAENITEAFDWWRKVYDDEFPAHG